MKVWAREVYRSLGKMLYCPFRDTVWAVDDFKIPDGFLNFDRVGYPWFSGRGLEVRPRRHFNHLSNCRDRRFGHGLKLSSEYRKSFGFLRI